MGNYATKIPETSCNYQEAQQDMKQQKLFKSNCFFKDIIKLPTLHKFFMLDIRKYRILSYQPFLSHHVIVVSDGKNEDITLELTKDEKYNKAMIPKSAVFDGNKDALIEMGTKDCSLYEQTEIAQQVFDNHGEYNLISNNCQDFCNKILRANGLPTYQTDSQIIITAFITTILILL